MQNSNSSTSPKNPFAELRHKIAKKEHVCQPIAEIMTKSVITIAATGSLKEALHIFREHNIRHVIVVDTHSAPKAVFSKRDLLVLQSAQSLGPLMEQTVLSRATQNPIIVAMDTCTRVAAQYMIENKIGCLPIVLNSSENSPLVGIVTESDFVQAYASSVQCACGMQQNTDGENSG